MIAFFKKAKKEYDNGGSPIQLITKTTVLCLDILSTLKPRVQGCVGNKTYSVYKKGNLSRPFLPELYIFDQSKYIELCTEMFRKIDGDKNIITCPRKNVDLVLYTTIMSFSLCFDLFKPTSRKTPGTFYEIVMGSILSLLLPSHTRKKHIQLVGESESISTDIVFEKTTGPKLVIPAKITTRERIVQPYAHQRILDSVFGTGTYKSVLVCVSETQRDRDSNVNDICVPGTIALFQKHLSQLAAIYYLDPPSRYLAHDVCDLVPVRTMSSFLCADLPHIIQN